LAPSVVLVTGVNRFLGGNLVARFAADPAIDRVLGVDTVPPSRELRRRMGRAEFVRADIRNPLIAKVISDAGVDTVVHAMPSTNPTVSGGRGPTTEMSVIGTMQLMAACQRSRAVRRVVVKSTSAVYGRSSRDPAVFTEVMSPKELPRGGFARDAGEIEGYVRGFNRRRPDVSVTVLRFTNVIGPRIDTALTRYFALPVVPTVLGQDSRIQLLHSDDALDVLERSAREDLPGVFNVGGSGVLLLSQAIRRAGRIPLPIPAQAAGGVTALLRGARLVNFSPAQLRALNLGCVVDTTKLHTEFGYTPTWSTAGALDDFVRGRQLRPVIDPDRVEAVERRVLSATRTGARAVRVATGQPLP
jgi:UDP-glucose 4-epimerase